MNDEKDNPPLGYFEDFLDFFIATLMPFMIGLMLGAVFVICFLVGFFTGL